MSGRSSVIADDEELDEEYADISVDSDEDDSETDEQPQPQTAGTVPDYEARFKGIQGSLQNSQEENKRLRVANALLQAAGHRNQLVAQGADEGSANAQAQAWLLGELQNMKGADITQKEQALEGMSRLIYAQGLAAQHGIEMNSPEFTRLTRVMDINDMEDMAKLIGSQKTTTTKANQRVKRAKQGSDQFGSANSGTTPRRKKAGSLAAAADRFAKIKIDI